MGINIGQFLEGSLCFRPCLTQEDINQIISTLGPYQPGTPGIKWTEDQASIIRSKILYLWKNWKKTAKDFDFGNPDQQEPTGTNTEYVYDPERKLSTKVVYIQLSKKARNRIQFITYLVYIHLAGLTPISY